VKKTQFSLFFMRECSDSRYQINFGGKEKEEKLYGFCEKELASTLWNTSRTGSSSSSF
jgi:hypothetical protein